MIRIMRIGCEQTSEGAPQAKLVLEKIGFWDMKAKPSGKFSMR